MECGDRFSCFAWPMKKNAMVPLDLLGGEQLMDVVSLPFLANIMVRSVRVPQ
jgi:hypothetical protein